MRQPSGTNPIAHSARKRLTLAVLFPAGYVQFAAGCGPGGFRDRVPVMLYGIIQRIQTGLSMPVVIGQETMATIDMPRLGAILDRESYEWLAAAHPDILAAIEAEVAAGRTAEQIRLFVVRHTGRAEIAQRCEQAARWVERENS